MKPGIIFLIALFLLLLVIFLTQYVMNIYEMRIKTVPADELAEPGDIISVTAIPVNAFGKKAWFRKPDTEFNFKSGKELIEIVENKKGTGKIVMRAGEKPGKVIMTAISKYSLAPNYIEFTIKPGR